MATVAAVVFGLKALRHQVVVVWLAVLAMVELVQAILLTATRDLPPVVTRLQILDPVVVPP